MTITDRIYEAVDDFGLITSVEAKELGISNVELANQAKRGKLARVARGVYRMPVWPYQEAAPYALAVKAAGESAALYGESVLSLLKLVPTNPARIWVSTTERTRRNLGDGIEIVRRSADEPITYYEGVPCQTAAKAISASAKTLGSERVLESVKEAKRQGYIGEHQATLIVEETEHDETAE